MVFKLRCVNFRGVLDPRRAFLPAFRVSGIYDDSLGSTIEVIVIGLGIPRKEPNRTCSASGSTRDNPWSAEDNPGRSWLWQRQICEYIDL